MPTVYISSVTNTSYKISHQIMANPGRNWRNYESVLLLVVWISFIKPVYSQDSETTRPDLQFAIKDSLIAVKITAMSFKPFINKVGKQLADISRQVVRWKLEKRNCSLDLHCPALDTDIVLATSGALEGTKKLSDNRWSGGILLELQIGKKTLC